MLAYCTNIIGDAGQPNKKKRGRVIFDPNNIDLEMYST
jgi:hypothetical protein